MAALASRPDLIASPSLEVACFFLTSPAWPEESMPMTAPDPKLVCHQLYTDQASVAVDDILQWTALLLALTISNLLFLLMSDLLLIGTGRSEEGS